MIYLSKRETSTNCLHHFPDESGTYFYNVGGKLSDTYLRKNHQAPFIEIFHRVGVSLNTLINEDWTWRLFRKKHKPKLLFLNFYHPKYDFVLRFVDTYKEPEPLIETQIINMTNKKCFKTIMNGQAPMMITSLERFSKEELTDELHRRIIKKKTVSRRPVAEVIPIDLKRA